MARAKQAADIEAGAAGLWSHATHAAASAGGFLLDAAKSVPQIRAKVARLLHTEPRRLGYFADILPVERAAINDRRSASRGPIKPLPPKAGAGNAARAGGSGPKQGDEKADADFRPTANPREPELLKMAPKPVACTATGLALSGGGIRSAATCLGAIQALNQNQRLCSVDYLSTVSGGGYIGCCLSAAMSAKGGGDYPFGDDISDSPAVSHLRNFSNYLLPRGRSAIRNAADIVVLVCRGLLANMVIALALAVGAALVTFLFYPTADRLGSGSFLVVLANRPLPEQYEIGGWMAMRPFSLTLALLGVTAVLLIFWALARSFGTIGDRPSTDYDWLTSDTRGRLLTLARWLIYLTAIVAILDLQPIAVKWVARVGPELAGMDLAQATIRIGPFVAFASAIAASGRRLGRFLETSQRTTGWVTLVLRLLTKLVILLAALIIPGLIWLAYLLLSAWPLYNWSEPAIVNLVPEFVSNWLDRLHWLSATPLPPLVKLYLVALPFLTLLVFGLTGNGYSLHRFYRDRLSKAFLFRMDQAEPAKPIPLDHLRLSDLCNGAGPYLIINAALNVQGSVEANKRGRNAEFFTFTPDFVGSNLTMYAPTGNGDRVSGSFSMESVDNRLDLATAMATSGAAISANMGGNTIRAMSATLALLNVRLGYWLRNPRFVGTQGKGSGDRLFGRLLEKFYLFAEMLNLLDETRRDVYLTDGGHIENLGLYELLKRGCGLILAVDAEADPNLSFESLLKVERYARIDLGVRIVLPWEEIARAALRANALIANRECPRTKGPHTAVGRIIYPNGAEGILVYFKASVTGDEKDYLIDYKLRYPEFPHENTSDQFFSEEQFEMYRALGFHIVQGFFGDDDFCYLDAGRKGFADQAAAREAVKAWLPTDGWDVAPAAG